MDLGFHNTREVLYPNNQPNESGYGRGIFHQGPVRGLGFPQHTQASFSMTLENRVCHLPMDCDCVGACPYFWEYETTCYVGYDMPPEQARPRLSLFFVTVYTGITFTHRGVNMNRQTGCKGVWGVSAPRGRVIVPRGSRIG